MIFKDISFIKTLQRLGDEDPLPGLCPWTPLETSVPRPLVLHPPLPNSWIRACLFAGKIASIIHFLVPCSKLNIRRHFFSHRSINAWNSLPASCIGCLVFLISNVHCLRLIYRNICM